MTKWGMAIDLDRCTGCQACVVACQQENNIPPSSPKLHAEGRSISWMHVQTEIEGEYPDVKVSHTPMMCQHCEHPPCTAVCPTSATYKGEEGIVGQIYPRCIGCRYCANACPYSIKYFNYHEPVWPDQMKPMLNEDVSVRYKGVVEKCTFCHHRLMHAREEARVQKRALRAGDYTPACVESCPASAMTFGNLDDRSDPVVKQTQSPRAFQVLEDLGTEPKVYYLKDEKA